ncbi:hypothetical protein D3C75_1221480 [compost metagenome]
MGIGNAVQHQQEWRFNAFQQPRQIVLLIFPPFTHPRNNALVDGPFDLLIQPLAVSHLDHNTGRFQLGNQRL